MSKQEFNGVYIEATNAEGFVIDYIPAPGVDPKTGISVEKLFENDIPEGTACLQLKQLWGDGAKYSDFGNIAY